MSGDCGHANCFSSIHSANSSWLPWLLSRVAVTEHRTWCLSTNHLIYIISGGCLKKTSKAQYIIKKSTGWEQKFSNLHTSTKSIQATPTSATNQTIAENEQVVLLVICTFRPLKRSFFSVALDNPLTTGYWQTGVLSLFLLLCKRSGYFSLSSEIRQRTIISLRSSHKSFSALMHTSSLRNHFLAA